MENINATTIRWYGKITYIVKLKRNLYGETVKQCHFKILKNLNGKTTSMGICWNGETPSTVIWKNK